MRDRDQLYDFLIGLDDVFSIVKTQILSMAPELNLGQAYHPVAEDEQQRMISAMTRPTAKPYHSKFKVIGEQSRKTDPNVIIARKLVISRKNVGR